MPTRPPCTTGARLATPAHPPTEPATPPEAVPKTRNSPSTAHLALVRPTADVLPLLDSVTLTPYERARAARLPAGRRREDYLAAHALVRLCAARLLDESPAALMLGQLCQYCGGEDHGRPFLHDHPDVGVSLSHARGAVAAAAGPGPVGVDVEDTSAAVFDPRVAARVLAPAELAAVRAGLDPPRHFLRLWVRKEALVKVGVTTLGGLRGIDLMTHAASADWRFADWNSTDGRLTAAVVAHTTPVIDDGSELEQSSSFAYSGEPHA
ncbi:4'-phosphopantetheinyl transferase family protein [Streptomyces fagopyri]|uniref:4'-phosphopantetheinyl transferase family protein n=1 Tax=Streptomyces fagopyri TaxID=2662397 RepID=UPI00371E88DB